MTTKYAKPVIRLTRDQLRVVRARLLPTWQTAAAIAQHSGLPAKTVLSTLRKHAADWGLESCVRYIDGHNQVSMFRCRQRILVMGVSFPMAGDDEGDE